MPVIKVNDQQYSLRPGQNRLGGGADADVTVADDAALGVQAIVDVAGDAQAVIRRARDGAAVRVNGVLLVDPTPLMHGDKVEIGGRELLYADDSKAGATQYVSSDDIAALAQKRSGPARATAATGGRLVSLVDGKEYTIPAGGISIGRDAGSGVVVAQNEVSRKHAEVAPVEHGYEIRDFSANGVFVNGARVDKAQILSRADVIRIGGEEFRFYADVPQSAKAAAPAVPPPVVASPVVDAPAPVATAAPDSRPVLAVLEITNEGPTKGQTYEIAVPLAHVGRGAHNDVVIRDDSVSDTHAKLQRRDDGWYLVDVGSTNGTYVAGQRLTAERRLEGAPDVRFGGVKAIFRARDAHADAGSGTRAIASVDRSKLRETVAVRSASPAQAKAAAASTAPPARSGLPAWLWIVVALAVIGAAAFFLMNR